MSYYKKTKKIIQSEKQVILPSGNVINYAESNTKGTAVLLLHGQTGTWQKEKAEPMPLLTKWKIRYRSRNMIFH